MSEIRKQLSIEEVLQKGDYVGAPHGISMLPMLKEGRDSIVVARKTQMLSPLDVALFRRGDEYVLHRVISVVDGGYVMRGDNTYEDEFVPEERVIGVLTEFFQGNKAISCTDKKYLRYVVRRMGNYKFRRGIRKIKWKVRNLFR